MRKTPINQIILEGPDLSGKSTLYRKLHKQSDFSWNIQDRSALSMLVYARLYGRDEYFHLESLKAELSNLNNVIVLLLPDWSLIAQRFEKRGDELQNFTSLRKVYDLFLEAATELENYPNVILFKKEVNDNDIQDLITHLKSNFENKKFFEYSKMFMQAASCADSSEKIGLSLTHYDNVSFSDVSEDMLLFKKEKSYYSKIRKKMMTKIEDELSGKNEYGRIETHESRRFIFSDDSCLSLCHFVLRNEFLYGEFYLRSSETKETLSYDMNFIKSLTRDVCAKLSEHSNIKMCKITLKIGSSHIV